MKKILLGLVILVFVALGAIYGLLFTKPGNSYVASIIEDKVNAGQKDVSLKVEDFVLTTNNILFKANIDNNSTINIDGKLSIFSKSVDLKYDINIKDLSKLKNITKQQLNGSFLTYGSVKGNQELTLIKGDSKVASSNTTYDIKLVDFNPSNILFKMEDAKLEELLYLINQPVYAKGLLNIDANIKSADVKNLNGQILTTISNGILNAKAINKELKQNPKTLVKFDANITSNLAGTFINSKVDFNSNLATLDTKESKVNLANSEINTDYKLAVKDLSLMEQIINQKLNGSFTTNGDVNIKDGVISVNGDSDIFKAKTNYALKLKDAKAYDVKVKLSKAKLDEILYLVNQPKYAKGFLNIDANIKNADVKNLDGNVFTTITDGLVNNKIVNKAFNQRLKQPLTFNADVKTKLVETLASSSLKVNTSKANLNMKEANYDLAKLMFTSDYTLDVKDLSKLFDVTGKKMRGAITLNGSIEQGKDLLKANGVSSLLGGNLNFTLNNDDFNTKIKDVEVQKLLHMMYYPVIFDSKSDLNLDYNLASKKGKVSGGLVNGKFLKNKYSTLINTFAKFDLTKEVYEFVKLNSDINDNIINNFIDMKSKYTKIVVPSSTIDTKKSTINALVQTTIKKTSFDTTIKGSLTKPKVKVDTSGLFKKKIEKKIEDKIKEKLGDKFKLENLFNKAPIQDNNAPKAASNEEIAKAFKAMFGN